MYQFDLAAALNYRADTLAKKLSPKPSARKATLHKSDVQNIILVLAKWETLTDRAEVFELLELAGLPPADCFTDYQWSIAPLRHLRNLGPYPTKPSPTTAQPPDLTTPSPTTWNLLINQVQTLADRVRQLEATQQQLPSVAATITKNNSL
jgi:hypothetical protein